MRGISILKDHDDKTRKLNNHTIMAFTGEAGDTGQLPFLVFVLKKTPSFVVSLFGVLFL